MFNKKYDQVLVLLDNKINFTQHMFDHYLKETENSKGLTEKEIVDNMMLRTGKWSYVDKYLAKLEALCELKREIEREIGQ